MLSLTDPAFNTKAASPRLKPFQIGWLVKVVFSNKVTNSFAAGFDQRESQLQSDIDVADGMGLVVVQDTIHMKAIMSKL